MKKWWGSHNRWATRRGRRGGRRRATSGVSDSGRRSVLRDIVESPSRRRSGSAYFKPGRSLHRPLCETGGYARRAAANSRPLVRRCAPEGKVERVAVVRPRAPPLHAPWTPVKCPLVSCQCRF